MVMTRSRLGRIGHPCVNGSVEVSATGAAPELHGRDHDQGSRTICRGCGPRPERPLSGAGSLPPPARRSPLDRGTCRTHASPRGRLRLLATLVQAAHGWTHPVVLSDEVVVMAFQDRSRAGPRIDDALKAIDYVS